MRSLEQIIADNGGDNTPAGDTHNLTGRARPEQIVEDQFEQEDEEPRFIALTRED